MYTIVYVNHIILTYSDDSLIHRFIEQIHKEIRH